MHSNKKEAARLGRAGEEFVAHFLKKCGYIIVKRNWRDKRYGEIDIVAESRDCIAFVEVKTRQKGALVSGIDAIDYNKMRRTKNAAIMFMKRFTSNLPARLDVAEVTVSKNDKGEEVFDINYIKSAF